MTRPTRRPSVRAIIVSSLVLVGLAAAPGAALAQPPPETVEYYATDALGSVRVVFTPTGQVIGRSDYLPFGDTQEQSGMLPRQRFTGQERDGLAGLDDFNARSLQMRTGRMSRPDPLVGNAVVNPQRWNRYAYALNNPLRYTDPTGLDAYDNDARVQAANLFAQEFWGLEAWDDFSREPWAIAWGYSYGPFSPRELYNAAFTQRDGGPTGTVTTREAVAPPPTGNEILMMAAEAYAEDVRAAFEQYAHMVSTMINRSVLNVCSVTSILTAPNQYQAYGSDRYFAAYAALRIGNGIAPQMQLAYDAAKDVVARGTVNNATAMSHTTVQNGTENLNKPAGQYVLLAQIGNLNLWLDVSGRR